VELSFLATHGGIDVAPDGSISWETQDVVKAVHELCATLERDVVSAPEGAAVQRVLDTSGWREDSVLAPTLRKIRDELGGVPTSLAYL
jgi:hypothetical protein